MSAPHRLLAIFALCALPALAACVSTANPDGWAPPTIADDTILLSLRAGELSAATFVGDTSIQVRWTFPNDNRANEKRLDPEGVYPPPIITESTIYLATHAEGVFALNLADGTVAWQRDDIGDTVVNAFSPVTGNRLAVGTSDGRLHLLDQSDGRTAAGWPADGVRLPAGIWASLVATDDALFAATMKGDLFAIDIATGAPRWPAPFHADGAILELALLPNGLLFVPSLDRNIHFVDAQSGASVGRLPTDDWVWMQPAMGNDSAYFGDLAGNVYAVDITNQTLRWKVGSDPADGFAAFHRIKSQPLLLNGVLVIADRAPAVHFLEAATGRRLNRVPLEAKTVRAPITPSGNVALVLSTNGKVFRADPVQLSVVQVPVGGAP